MDRFEFIFSMPPIDWWSGALAVDVDEELRVLGQMPEVSRDGRVYKLYIPYSGDYQLRPIYLCKAENNGTVYLFSDFDVRKAFINLESEFVLIQGR